MKPNIVIFYLIVFRHRYQRPEGGELERERERGGRGLGGLNESGPSSSHQRCKRITLPRAREPSRTLI